MHTPNNPETRPYAKHRRLAPTGRHRWAEHSDGRHRTPTVPWRDHITQLRSDSSRWGAAGIRHLRSRHGSVAAALLLVVGLAPVAVTGSTGDPGGDEPTGVVPTSAPAALAERSAAADTASRSSDRDAASVDADEIVQALPEAVAIEPVASPDDSDDEDSDQDEDREDSRDDEDDADQTPEPVGGLNEQQMAHAAAIVQVGKDMDLPEQAWVVALATAMQESTMKVLANPAYPESYDVPNDGTGSDHDSVGLFQQRPASGWGSVEELMDPETSARKFYEALEGVSGWEEMAVTVAAQTVQVSAFPDHYAKHEPLARELVDALS